MSLLPSRHVGALESTRHIHVSGWRVCDTHWQEDVVCISVIVTESEWKVSQKMICGHPMLNLFIRICGVDIGHRMCVPNGGGSITDLPLCGSSTHTQGGNIILSFRKLSACQLETSELCFVMYFPNFIFLAVGKWSHIMWRHTVGDLTHWHKWSTVLNGKLKINAITSEIKANLRPKNVNI